MVAPEPPQLRTLAEFATFDPETKALDIESRLNDPTAILEICSSLVAYEESTGEVRLAHDSVRQHLSALSHDRSSSFFYGVGIRDQGNRDEKVATACLSYLLLEDFAHGPVEHYKFIECLADYPLLAYAAQNWTLHVRCSSRAGWALQGLISRLMTPHVNAHFLFWVQVMLYHSGLDFQIPGTTDNPTTLYYSAAHGLRATVLSLIAKGVDLNVRAGRFGGTALHAASWRRHSFIVEDLLRAGADYSIKDYGGNTAYDLLDLDNLHDDQKRSLTSRMNPAGDATAIIASRTLQSTNQTELDRYMIGKARANPLVQSAESVRQFALQHRTQTVYQLLQCSYESPSGRDFVMEDSNHDNENP